MTTARLVRLPAAVTDAGLLIARVLLGVILMTHGWQMLVTNGLGATTGMFQQIGIPLAAAAAVFAAFTQFVGGALLILGLLTQLAGVCVIIQMLGAWWFVHRGHGVLSQANGWELVGALGIAALLFVVVGPGRYALDAVFTRGRRHVEEHRIEPGRVAAR